MSANVPNFDAIWSLPKAQQAEAYAKMNPTQQAQYREALAKIKGTKKRAPKTKPKTSKKKKTEPTEPKLQSVAERTLLQLGRTRKAKAEIEHNTSLSLVDIKADAKISIAQNISNAIQQFKGETIQAHHDEKALKEMVKIRYKEGKRSKAKREKNALLKEDLEMDLDELIAKKDFEIAQQKELKRIFWNGVKNIITLGGVTRKAGRLARLERTDMEELELRGVRV